MSITPNPPTQFPSKGSKRREPPPHAHRGPMKEFKQKLNWVFKGRMIAPARGRMPQPPARSVLVFRNGDPHFPGRRFVLNERQAATFEAFLAQVTRGLQAPYGAVRRLYTPAEGHRVRSLDALRPGAAYVAAGSETFKKIDYSQIVPTKRERSLHRDAVQIRPVAHSRIVASAKWSKPQQEPVTIFVYANGDALSAAVRLLVPARALSDWQHVLAIVTEKVHLRTGAVRRLYSPSGQLVWDGSELENGHSYVATGTEKFKRLPYAAGGLAKASPRHSSSKGVVLPPLVMPRRSRDSSHNSKSPSINTLASSFPQLGDGSLLSERNGGVPLPSARRRQQLSPRDSRAARDLHSQQHPYQQQQQLQQQHHPYQQQQQQPEHRGGQRKPGYHHHLQQHHQQQHQQHHQYGDPVPPAQPRAPGKTGPRRPPPKNGPRDASDLRDEFATRAKDRSRGRDRGGRERNKERDRGRGAREGRRNGAHDAGGGRREEEEDEEEEEGGGGLEGGLEGGLGAESEDFPEEVGEDGAGTRVGLLAVDQVTKPTEPARAAAAADDDDDEDGETKTTARAVGVGGPLAPRGDPQFRTFLLIDPRGGDGPPRGAHVVRGLPSVRVVDVDAIAGGSDGDPRGEGGAPAGGFYLVEGGSGAAAPAGSTWGQPQPLYSSLSSSVDADDESGGPWGAPAGYGGRPRATWQQQEEQQEEQEEEQEEERACACGARGDGPGVEEQRQEEVEEIPAETVTEEVDTGIARAGTREKRSSTRLKKPETTPTSQRRVQRHVNSGSLDTKPAS
ncbi:unnamed protein product [Lampetra fluviatilis]